VDQGASGLQTGNSWADALTTLQDALQVTEACELWVAKGMYYPDQGSSQADNDRTATITLQSGVAIYGGFAGTETSRDQRNWETNVTVLSGDIDQNDVTDLNGVVTDTANIQGTNAYHVVTGAGVTETAVLDGFVITAGQANGDNWLDNHGGGMYGYESSPTLTNVTFSGNTAVGGGGMYIEHSSPILTNVTFRDNLVRGGGGIDSYESSPILTNVTFSGNTALEIGGGMANWSDSHPSLTNVILWGNSAPQGAGIFNADSVPQISCSDIQGCGSSGSWDSACGTDGGGNIVADPLFVDAANGNLRLQLTSLAIDAGDNTALPPGILTDLDSSPRFVDIPTVPDTGSGAPPIVDMGAYEAQYMDVTLSKAVLPSAAAPGEAITFTLAVSNTGSLPVTGIVVTDTIPAWLKGVTFSSTLTVTDSGSIPPFVWQVQDLALGQSGLITVNGMLAIPLAAGTYANTASISATDDFLAENNTADITFTVPNVKPIFTSTPVIAAAEDESYTYTATAQDDNGDTLTITATTLPDWLTIEDHNNSTATLSGTPTDADVGDHTVELEVIDSAGLPDTQAFTLTVAYDNDPPFFTSTPVTTATQDVLYTYTVTADDPDLILGDSLTITATTLPDWLTIEDHNNGTATLSGTPIDADVGDHTVELEVTDSAGLPDTQAFTVTVDYFNDTPFFTSTPLTTATQDVLYTYTVTADDPNLILGDTLTITATTLPDWLTIEDHNNGTATVAGTPTTDDLGEHTVVLRVVDRDGLSSTQTFTIAVWNWIYLPLVLRN
ncbi:MAG: DUF11 domain-containing protein, partial [Anaerolineaceae bacterium]|nr:DUF11 domain-containing protein [Anaerolineaceae bacterium]